MTEPECVDPRPLRVGLRVGNRNGITSRQSNDHLLRRVDDAVQAAASIFELKYRIDLLGVRALKADNRTLYVARLGRRTLVVAVKHYSGENEDRGERER